MGIYNTIKSKTYYEFIASQYCHIRERRLNYLNAIDELIIENFSSKVCNVLDVGAGDGYRGLKIFKALDASYILLLDESPEMLKGIDSVSPEINVFAGSIQHFESPTRFDLILCLWNVLGHVSSFDERVSILEKLKSLLLQNGTIVIDFNNRYNYKQYGIISVAMSIFKSLFTNEPGWFYARNSELVTSVYIHNFTEIKKMLSKANLSVKKHVIVDYDSGKLVQNLYKGQIVLFLGHPD